MPPPLIPVLLYPSLIPVLLYPSPLCCPGAHCNITCPAGSYGQDCAKVCTCQNGGLCDHITGFCSCVNIFSGDNCTIGEWNMCCPDICPIVRDCLELRCFWFFCPVLFTGSALHVLHVLLVLRLTAMSDVCTLAVLFHCRMRSRVTTSRTQRLMECVCAWANTRHHY